MGHGPPGYRIGKRIPYGPSDVQRWMVEQGWSRLSAVVNVPVRTGASSRRLRASHLLWTEQDQQLGSTVADRLHRVPDPTIPAVPSPTNQAGQLSPTWPSRL